MTCPNCHRETQAGFFCHACDAYVGDPSVGTKAGIARRLAAQILDGLLVWVFILVIAGLSIGVGAAGGGGSAFSTFFLAVVAYAVFTLWFLSRGKTPGKFLVGTRVVDKKDGTYPGLGRMLIRETFGKFLSGLFFGLGYFWAIWDRESQAWHDKVAGTLVVRNLAIAGGATATLDVPAQTTTANPHRPPASRPVPTHAVELRTDNQELCPSCSTPAVAGGRFCEECGTQLS